MTTWLPRGLLLAIGMVLLRLVQGSLINASPTNAGTISFALCGLFGVAAFIWGLLDGMADARANPDPRVGLVRMRACAEFIRVTDQIIVRISGGPILWVAQRSSREVVDAVIERI